MCGGEREEGMFLVVQHIHYPSNVWRREGGRNVRDAAAHTLSLQCVEERGRKECSWCCSTYITRTLCGGVRKVGIFLVLQHIHYQDTVWRSEEGRNIPGAAAHTLPGHRVEE